MYRKMIQELCQPKDGEDMYRIGIDAGTTVTKLVAMRDGQLVDRIRVDSEPSDDDILALYESFIMRNKVKTDEIESINLTGVGATAFDTDIDGIKPTYIHEFDANVSGANYIAGNIDDFLLISLGTGTAYIRVKDNTTTHVGGLGMGGGTVRGLAKYIVGTRDVSELSMLTEKGDIGNVNLTMADVSKAKFEGLTADLTASNFGKTEVDASREDLTAGIYSLVIENVIQTGCMMAGQLGVKNIVMIGGLCNSSMLDNRIKVFRTMYPDFNFIKAEYGSYVTAIGTALAKK